MYYLRSLLFIFVSILRLSANLGSVHCQAFSLSLVMWLIFSIIPLPAHASRVFVSTSNPNQLKVYALDEQSGTLSLENNIPTSGPPGCFSFNEAGDRLYVSIRQLGKITAYALDENGQATQLNEVSAESYPGYVRVHESGKFLFCSYYQAGQVNVYGIHEDGALSQDPIQTIKTDANAHAVVTDPKGEYLFVPHTRPNKIFQFKINTRTGNLTPTNPPFLQRAASTGPRHLWFHPTSSIAYGSNEQGSSISTYSLDTRDGTFSTIETLSSLPTEFSDNNSTADIEVHPSGEFVYIANRGHNSIASYAIDEIDGTLSFIQHTFVEPVPRSFNITPDGDFLIAAGQQSGKLRVFRIDEKGQLKHTQTLNTEGAPWWVVSQP